MTRRSRAIRLALAFFGLVQAGLPPVAAYADAQVHHVAGIVHGTHVARPDRNPGHAAGSHECPLCTFLSHVAVSNDLAIRTPAAAELADRTIVPQGRPRTFVAWDLPRSRAPPLA
ncbi:MAG: DUF2946 family protein [Candidatus Palauibacterales bacterium]|nr:DUF2946 family protein [Candidatus Palauibacterales bacterium]MDP2530829.1 DUF2946 family protein [Candidatus Palauibacterales bacterium]MDP2584367.1 DUF2946 family protein [Candidatus Palauibacterales bacterium]